MKPLSQKLAELSVHAKNTEDRVRQAQTEAHERIEERRDKIRQETDAALEKVKQGLGRAGENAQAHALQLKTKVESDIEQLKQQARRKFETWQIDNHASVKEAEAKAAVDYAIASVKLAELAALDAIGAQLEAENKAVEVKQAQPA